MVVRFVMISELTFTLLKNRKNQHKTNFSSTNNCEVESDFWVKKLDRKQEFNSHHLDRATQKGTQQALTTVICANWLSSCGCEVVPYGDTLSYVKGLLCTPGEEAGDGDACWALGNAPGEGGALRGSGEELRYTEPIDAGAIVAVCNDGQIRDTQNYSLFWDKVAKLSTVLLKKWIFAFHLTYFSKNK